LLAIAEAAKWLSDSNVRRVKAGKTGRATRISLKGRNAEGNIGPAVRDVADRRGERRIE
jgi:hypothetical protein